MSLFRTLKILDNDKHTRYRMAFGKAEDGGTETFATGLSTVLGTGCSMGSVPTLDIMMATSATMVQTGSTWGQIRIRHWGATATDNATPEANAGAVDTYWWAVGT